MPGLPLRVELPWPPSVNHAWRTVAVPRGGGRGGPGFQVVLSRAGRAFRRDAVARLAGRYPLPRGGLPGRLAVSIELRPPTRRAFDIDNRVKALLDAMQHAGVYRDDGQIDELRVVRGAVAPGGVATIEITEASDV